MKPILLSFIILILTLPLFSISCKKEPFYPNFKHAGGYIIGKEICNLNPDDDYWLIDLSSVDNPLTFIYGDSITINGILYKHMVKTKQLVFDFRIIGKKVSFDFHLSNNKLISTGCAVLNPITFNLKEMYVLASFNN